MATLHSPYLVGPEPQTPTTHSSVIVMTFTTSRCHLHFYLITTGISQDGLGYAVLTNNPQISAPQERGTFLSCAAWPSWAGCGPAACHLPSRTQTEGQRKHNMANHVSALNTPAPTSWATLAGADPGTGLDVNGQKLRSCPSTDRQP